MDAEAPGDIGDGLRVIAGGRSDNADGALRSGQGQHSVEGTPFLEGARHLQVFELQVNGCSRLLAQGFGAGQG